MRNSSQYAKGLKKFFQRLKRSCPKSPLFASDNPLDHLIFAVLSESNSPARSKTAVGRLLSHVVDYNDLRVSTTEELARQVETTVPESRKRVRVLNRILNAIYDQENAVTLEPAKARNKKDARAYLEQLDGMTPYVLSSTMLWGFGEHTIPVDDQILEVLKKETVVAPDADVEMAQSFLRRHICAADATTFAALLKRYASQRASRSAAASRSKKVKKETKKKLRGHRRSTLRHA